MTAIKINYKRGANVLLLALFVTGCAETEIRTLSSMPPQGSRYSQALAEEYENLALRELRTFFDECSALHFACKGQIAAAGAGESLKPERLENWRLSDSARQELQPARQRLLRVFACGSREQFPQAAAAATRYFDEWVEQSAEGWQKDEIANARAAFYRTLAILEKSCARKQPLSLAQAYTIFFEHNSDALEKAALETIDRMARYAKDHEILLIGETDASGSAAYDRALARRRAEAVKNALVRRGAPPRYIKVRALGKAPGAAFHDPRHRRVSALVR